jgi:hypothetical protein
MFKKNDLPKSLPGRETLETQYSKDKIKSLLLEVIAREKPENTERLTQIMQQIYNIKPELTTKLLTELENEGKLHFTKPQKPVPMSAKEYVFSENAFWYWGIIVFSIATVISVFTISDAIYPLAYVRNALGIIFVLFLPGYAFIKALFPTIVPIKTSSENLDNVERIALGLGMSIALVPIVGLILNYTPWGIRLTPIVISLLALTFISATVALLREYEAKTIKASNE